MKKLKLACIGNFGLDVIKFKNKDKKIIGGSGFRFAATLALFKQSLFLFTNTGKKEEIDKALKILKKNKVTVINANSTKTPLFTTIYDYKHQVKTFKFINEKDNNRALAKIICKSQLSSFDWLHICPLSINLVKGILKKKNNEAIVSLQLHLSQFDKKSFKSWEKILGEIDYLFASIEDFSFLGQKQMISFKSLSEKIKKTLFITCGKKGVLLFTKGKRGDKIHSLVTRKIEDTTGAGDVFAAGTVLGLIHFKKMINATRLGVLLSALSLSGWGNENLFNILKNEN